MPKMVASKKADNEKREIASRVVNNIIFRTYLWPLFIGVLLIIGIILSGVTGFTSVNILGLSALGIVLIFTVLMIVSRDRKYLRYVLILPATVILFAVTILPTIYTFYISFHEVTVLNFITTPWPGVGFKNFTNLILNNPQLWTVVIRTVEYAVITIGVEFIIGMGLALFFLRQFKGRNLVRALLIAPMVLTPVVAGMLWRYMFDFHFGLLNQLLGMLGIEPKPWLTDQPIRCIQKIPLFGKWLVKNLNANYGFVAITFVDIWQWTPFVFLCFLAGLSSLPREPYEAAMIDGASSWQAFRYVTLPLMKRTIVVVLLLRIMDVTKVYDTIWALFQVRLSTRTISMYIAAIMRQEQDFGKAGALSILTLIVVMVVATIFVSLVFKQERGD